MAMAASTTCGQGLFSCISTLKGSNKSSSRIPARICLRRINSAKIQATPLHSVFDSNANRWRKSSMTISAAVRHLTGSITKTEGLHFAVIVARFNDIITKPLVEGALDAFRRHSVREEDIDVIWVPGSFEIPLVAQTVAKSGKYHAVICIGAVVRGATTHYEAVANSAASGVLSAGLNSGVPCILGVLTCDTMEQAMDRAGGKVGNKGAEAAVTAGMLSSPQVTVRTRAFDLVLNLGIHAQLLEPMLSEDQSAIVEEPSSQSTHFSDENQFFGTEKGKSKSYKLESGTPQAVSEFEIWLLNILNEILLFLVQIEEKEEVVWASALSCLMYMICDRGRIQRCRLNGLDVRVLKALLEISRENSWAEELHCALIRLLSNLLYNIPDGAEKANAGAIDLDIQQIELIGGIEFICEEYARANAVEAKNNLFGVLFGYVFHELKSKCLTRGNSMPADDEIQAIATVLSLADAPEAFSVALKLGLHGVGEELKKSIVTAMSRDVTSGHLNALLLEDIVGSLDSVVAYYAHLDDEFSEMLRVTMVNESLTPNQQGPQEHDTIGDSVSVSQAWTTLDSLLHSSRAIYRQNGYFWLVELLFAEIIRESNKLKIQNLQQQFGLFGGSERSDSDDLGDQNSPHISSSLRLLSGLLKSKYNYIRWGFIFILERLLLRCQLSVLDENTAHGEADGREFRHVGTNSMYTEEKANAVIGLMNATLSQIFLANETDRIMILKMCDLLFSQLCLRISPSMVPSIQSKAYIRDNTTFGSLSNSNNVYDKSESLLFRTDQGEGHYEDDRHLNRSGSGSGLLNSSYKSTSMAALLLRGYAAAPRQLVACIPTALLYWPLIQLAGAATDDIALGIAVGSKGRGNIPGGASDIRGALLLLLIGKCTTDQTAFQEVGGEEFFRSLLDDTDARVAYYTSGFLLKRMMTEEPEKYQRMLHDIVFKAQQSNNEKLLENPYLQMRGILHLSSDLGSQLSFQES